MIESNAAQNVASENAEKSILSPYGIFVLTSLLLIVLILKSTTKKDADHSASLIHV
jgi:hypothetical protein